MCVQRSNGACPKKKFKERLKLLRFCFSLRGSLSSKPPRVTETLPGSLGRFANCSQGWKEQTSSLQVELEPRRPLGFQLQILN